MSSASFFDQAAKASVRDAIQRVEKQTCAEVVVAVKRQAGLSYRDVEMGFGAAVGLFVLCLLLFLPKEFSVTWMPVDVAVSFGLGLLLCRQASWLKRLFVSRRRREAETRRAAALAFQEMGIGRTSGRHGILVLVGVFERSVAVLPDVGVDAALLRDASVKLDAAISRADPSLDAFLEALGSIGPALAPTMPCREDDVNELPDEVGES